MRCTGRFYNRLRVTNPRTSRKTNFVQGIDRHQRSKKRLTKIVDQVQRKLKKADRSLARFRDYFKYLDRHPPEKMRKAHVERVVQLHTQDYSCDWESRLAIIKKTQQAAGSFVRSLDHYTNSAVESLNAHNQGLALASDDLRQVQEAMTKDTKILRTYVGVIYRLRKTLWGQSMSSKRSQPTRRCAGRDAATL